MAKTTPAPAPETPPPPVEQDPQEGGSYIRNEDGSLTKVVPPQDDTQKEAI